LLAIGNIEKARGQGVPGVQDGKWELKEDREYKEDGKKMSQNTP